MIPALVGTAMFAMKLITFPVIAGFQSELQQRASRRRQLFQRRLWHQPLRCPRVIPVDPCQGEPFRFAFKVGGLPLQ